MKQLKQNQTECLTKLERENIKNKLRWLIFNYNNKKQFINKDKQKNQSSTNIHDNSKISLQLRETNIINVKIVSKKWLLHKSKFQQQVPLSQIPPSVIKPKIRLKLFVNSQQIQNH
ncbi:unnamed protein product [Paramecium pentaurelia]|uniref:Uncharacterized protein n=1 Tax=Paramecium pentaurelia TaxID=43138 RepID=A0A8S1SGC6_9CILI|nr:unnamed protein product [Paramecium pentaurelia]